MRQTARSPREPAMQYLMITNRNRDGDGLGGDLAAPTFYSADAATDPNKLSTLSTWTKVTRAAFVQQLKQIADSFPLLSDAQNKAQRHVCLFVHGFNTSWTDAVQDYVEIKSKLIEPAELGQLVLFTWPSKGSVAGYLPDRSEARDSAP